MSLTNQIVIEKAKEIGFNLIGFSRAENLSDEVKNLEKWISNGFHATMDYMKRNIEKRKDVNKIFPSAKSVISLALNYYTNKKHTTENGFGKISRYAWGKDYHLIIWDKLKLLEEDLKKIEPEFESISYVDTGPIMDKVWAVKSGIGWMGKHSNIISREIGSWFFIATIITNWEFENNSTIKNFCGNCTACIDACPTDAIVKDYVVDSNRCISFLTIENKGDISKEFQEKFDGWIFGCDICQDVCPWNQKFSVQSSIREFESIESEIKLNNVLEMNSDEFSSKYEVSPIKRAKLKGLQRNANFLLKN
ncbi:MAG: tRNA epoxyqueuosine(34) reductase QueG [Ignavibacteria bacterium]|nr:tRNA epoxyqueuosine(34) reductase QueG [Ignavibacteria bacterium]